MKKICSSFVLLSIFISLTGCSLENSFYNAIVAEGYLRQERNYPSSDQVLLSYYHYIPDPLPSNNSKGIILWHGGGWKSGSKDAMNSFCSAFAKEGIHCFAPSYRLWHDSTDSPLDAKEDAMSFWRYLTEDTESFGVDKTSLFVGGASAGANLSAHIMDSPKILISPVLKTTGEYSFENETLDHHSEIGMDAIETLRDRFESASGPEGSPIESVMKENRVLIFHGTRDFTVPIEGSRQYCQLLKENCDKIEIEGAGHTDLSRSEPLRKLIIESTMRWME